MKTAELSASDLPKLISKTHFLTLFKPQKGKKPTWMYCTVLSILALWWVDQTPTQLLSHFLPHLAEAGG